MATVEARTLHTGDSGEDVRAVQRALNARAAPRDYPPIGVDGVVGPSTVWAYHDLGHAVGFLPETLRTGITPGAQRLLADPAARERAQLERERQRAPGLASRTIAFDGTPVFWGLAKPLQRAREAGWGGTLNSGDRRSGYAERYGKASQAKLYSCDQSRGARAGARAPARAATRPTAPAARATSCARTAPPSGARLGASSRGGSSGSTARTPTGCSPRFGASATRCGGPTPRPRRPITSTSRATRGR